MKIFINTAAGNGHDTWQLAVRWMMTEEDTGGSDRAAQNADFIRIRIEDAADSADETAPEVISQTEYLLCGSGGTFRVQIKGVRPWSPADPVLYTADILLSFRGREIKVRERVGFRSIEKRGNKVF